MMETPMTALAAEGKEVAEAKQKPASLGVIRRWPSIRGLCPLSEPPALRVGATALTSSEPIWAVASLHGLSDCFWGEI